MRPVPFLVKKPKTKIVPVGSETTGFVYLSKKGFICPAENPVDHQHLQRKQREFFTAYNKRVKELSKELGLSQAEVRNKLAGLQTQNADPDSPDVKVDDGDSLLDYLDGETLEMMYSLQEDARTLAIRSATFMLQYRAAVPVVLKKEAQADARKLSVEGLSMPLGKGAKLQFGDYSVTVRDFANYGEESLMVENIPAPLKVTDVGFLCDGETGQIKVGFPDWTIDNTKDAIGEELIAALYNFYQVEAGEAFETDEEPKEEVSEDSVGESENFRSLTGGTSTTDSSTSDVEMSASTTETLEASPVG